jgi:catechol-2,3-dioxygenase
METKELKTTEGRNPSGYSVQIEQKKFEMPPREGISIAHFLTVTDIERSARFYEKVFGARILSMGNSDGACILATGKYLDDY